MPCILTSLPRNKTRPFITKELGVKHRGLNYACADHFPQKDLVRGTKSIEEFGPGEPKLSSQAPQVRR